VRITGGGRAITIVAWRRAVATTELGDAFASPQGPLDIHARVLAGEITANAGMKTDGQDQG